jgi:L-alanine-DL-glutamate epimerase-like enolase superfamily enzyme
MKITFKQIELKLTTPFRISRNIQVTSPNIFVQISHLGHIGYGEAAPDEYYGENPATVAVCLEKFAPLLGDDPFALEEIRARLNKEIALHPSAKAAVDMALYDLIGKITGVPLYKLLGLSAAQAPQTSFTLGIASPEEMAQKATLAREYPIFKIKVGTDYDYENLKAIREVSQATLRLDANTAWTPKEAIRKIRQLEPFGIEFVEQPVPAQDLAGLKLIRQNVDVPIFADESCVTVKDIPLIADCVDGINIKLMKCGGLGKALEMIHVARAYNLQIMLGCMIESSLAITAATQLSPLVDYADLDGHLLISNDPCRGVSVKDGKLILPEGPGLGVEMLEVIKNRGV